MILIIVSIFIGYAHSDTLQLNYTNHWTVNSGGTRDSHIPNFINDMIGYYDRWSMPVNNEVLITSAAWDEGGCAGCIFSMATGANIGRLDVQSTIIKDYTHSDTAQFGSDKCQINNFWARASYAKLGFVGHNGPPPTGISAPSVSCSNGDVITTSLVADPSALAFDNTGNLLIGDAGPDQNIKIFTKTLGHYTLLRTFGDSGGIYAKKKIGMKTYKYGQVGPKRFNFIRGIVIDTPGNIYVANTGNPEQGTGGSDIRKFSHIDSSLVWQTLGLAFLNTGDADPASGGTSISVTGKRTTMDYTKAPGSSWTYSSVTIDPFKWPYDPRFMMQLQNVYERRIQGKRFQYSTDMQGEVVYVLRFVDSSEVGIPTAFFNMSSDLQLPFRIGTDTAPNWVRVFDSPKRWYWVDRNGDGIAQANEYGIYNNYAHFQPDIDIDENGNIWQVGTGIPDTTNKIGGVTEIIAGTLDINGVPLFNMTNIKHFAIPYVENMGKALRIKHVIANDVLYLATAPVTNQWYPTKLHIYDHFTTIRQNEVCVLDLGYNDNGQSSINLDVNTETMTLPYSITADADYVYVTYLDRGRYSRIRGEITVYNAHTCQPKGWIAPTAVTEGYAGAIDMRASLHVTNGIAGSKIILQEEDAAGKVMVYRWYP